MEFQACPSVIFKYKQKSKENEKNRRESMDGKEIYLLFVRLYLADVLIWHT